MLDNFAWVLNEFEGLDLGDERLNRRAKTVAMGMLRRPAQSIPKQSETAAAAKAAYRLLSNQAVDRDELQAPHRAATIRRVLEFGSEPVLFVQDTCTLSFNSHTSTVGLGPIGISETPGYGALIHNCIALATNTEVLGLANQLCWVRPLDVVHKRREKRTAISRAQRPDRESRVWYENLEGIGPVPEGHFWVSVGDRGSDHFEFWVQSLELGWHCLSRVFIDRRIASIDDDESAKYLLESVRTLLPVDTFQVHERARTARAARTLNLNVAFTNLELRAPRKRDDLLKAGPLSVGVVRCWDKKHDVEWLLVTTWPIADAAAAREVIEWYEARWTVEEYHKCLKTGLGIETSQLETFDGIERLLGIQSVLAVRLLQLQRAARLAPDTPAAEAVDPDFLEVLRLRRPELRRRTLTLYQFYREIARFGGFLARKGDGEPGWQSLWCGFLHLLPIVEGYRLGRTCG